MTIQISYAPSLTAPLELREFADLAAMGAWLQAQPPVTRKTDSAIIVAGVFKNYPVPATERTIENMRFSTGALLDFDAGDVTAQEASQELENAGIEYLTRTSFSHAIERPRFSVFVPWSEPCPPAQHAAAIDKYIKPKLNGHGSFAAESRVPVQPRFIQPPSTGATIMMPAGESWEFSPINIELADLPTLAAVAAGAYDPFAHVDLRPESRQLFRLALQYIDADADRETWVSVLGCGLRMFGITPASLREKKLSQDQWDIIAELEAFSSRGSAGKYQRPENGKGIDSCTATRRNADGEWVPSMVMQYGAKLITGTSLVTLTGIIKRTDFVDFDDHLTRLFPELVEEARTRFGHDLPTQAVLPSSEELATATAQGVARVAAAAAAQALYLDRIKGVLKVMPDGRTKRLAGIIATLGNDEDKELYRFNPAAAIVIACQLINTITAHRVFTKHGTLPPLSGNLYAMYFDVSGSGKSAAVSYARRILTKAGYEDAIIPRKVFSGSGMFNAIATQGVSCFFTADEAKSWLGGSTNKNDSTSTNKMTLDAFFLELWLASCRENFLMPSGLAQNVIRPGQPVPQVIRLRQPNVSVLVTGVPDDLELLTAGMYSSGSLARTLCFLPIEEHDTTNPCSWVDIQDALFNNTDATVRDREIEVAAGMLRDLDRELQDQNLGVSLASVKAGNGFVEDGEEPVPYRDFTFARAEVSVEQSRILLPTVEANRAMSEILRRMSLRYASNLEKLMPFLQRVREIAYRIALSTTIFDNPLATEIDVEHATYACELVALIEEPWFDRIGAYEKDVVHAGPYQELAQACAALLDKRGELYNTPAGMSVSQMRDKHEFAPLNKIIRGLRASSEVVRRESQKTLDLLGIKMLPNPAGKGWFVHHPDHAPQPTEEELNG